MGQISAFPAFPLQHTRYPCLECASIYRHGEGIVPLVMAWDQPLQHATLKLAFWNVLEPLVTRCARLNSDDELVPS